MAPEYSSLPVSPRGSSANAVTPATGSSANTASAMRRSDARPPIDSQALPKASAVVASRTDSPGARATAPCPVRLLPHAAARMVEIYQRSIWDIVDSGNTDQEIRSTLTCQFQKAEHKDEFLIAMGECIKASLRVSESSMPATPDRAARSMSNVGSQIAFYACVNAGDANDLKAKPLTRWLNTIDLPFMANHPERQLWMNQAAVFSFLTYAESARGMEPWSAVPHPDWLRDKRQILRDLIPADLERMEEEILATTDLPRVLSEVTAQYAFVREWDECLARLQGASGHIG